MVDDSLRRSRCSGGRAGSLTLCLTLMAAAARADDGGVETSVSPALSGTPPDTAAAPPQLLEPASPPWLSQLFTNTAPVGLALHAEVGLVGVASNRIQLGRDGTDLDYQRDAAQNTLFPFLRFSADVSFFKRHTVVLLFQPLELSTSQVLARDLIIDQETFRAGTPVDFLYGFSFWRLSYLYNFLWARPGMELSVGLSLQLRNARITFASRDGTQFRSNENIGPVPIVKVRSRYTFANRLWLGAEFDGFYAATPGFNGSNTDFIGAIFDGSLRVGVELTPAIDGFLNVRTILGGAVGTERNPTLPADGYVRNWLYTFSASVGFTLKAPGRGGR